MNNKVLVTGGCGFIGSHVVKNLIDTGFFRVAVVDNLSSGKFENLRNLEVDFYKCDILDQFFKRVFIEFCPDYVIHLAAQGNVTTSLSDMVLDAEINIKGSLEIIELAKLCNVKKVIFASSAAVYGEPKYLPIDEEHKLNPLSPYGLSKLTVENYLQLSAKLYGIDYTILRFSNVYGTNQRADTEGGVIAIFTSEVLRGLTPKIFGDGTQTRDFINVEDVSEAIIRSIFYGRNQIFNISSNEAISIKDVLETILGLTNRNSLIKYENSKIGDIKDSLLDNNKASRLINWKPQISLETGLKEVVEFEKGKLLKLVSKL